MSLSTRSAAAVHVHAPRPGVYAILDSTDAESDNGLGVGGGKAKGAGREVADGGMRRGAADNSAGAPFAYILLG